MEWRTALLDCRRLAVCVFTSVCSRFPLDCGAGHADTGVVPPTRCRWCVTLSIAIAAVACARWQSCAWRAPGRGTLPQRLAAGGCGRGRACCGGDAEILAALAWPPPRCVNTFNSNTYSTVPGTPLCSTMCVPRTPQTCAKLGRVRSLLRVPAAQRVAAPAPRAARALARVPVLPLVTTGSHAALSVTGTVFQVATCGPAAAVARCRPLARALARALACARAPRGKRGPRFAKSIITTAWWNAALVDGIGDNAVVGGDRGVNWLVHAAAHLFT